jgi:DNA polymerase epsilon subunit 1
LYEYEPYFYLKCESKDTRDIIIYLNNTFETLVSHIEYIDKVDLGLLNHLSGKTQKYVKLNFKTVEDLLQVRTQLSSIIERNNETLAKKSVTENVFMKDVEVEDEESFLMKIIELREYDVTYYNRVCIDNEIRVAYWYELQLEDSHIKIITHMKEKLDKPDLRVLAFDIETTKAELKFPDPQVDSIMMISYMIDGKGFLITNREVISEDIDDFEYTPVPEYEGRFTVFNEPNEESLLNKFFSHVRETKPFVFVTYNGDYFDWPFIETRASIHGMSLESEIGIVAYKNRLEVAYHGRFATHLDCFYWVKRDAYLPQGSHGLKKVTVAKLGYDPVELDPEKMLEFAHTRPQDLASYSVSDALATYYLYYKMIHDFIFALCTIIPSHPDDVLRKGSGTLCEELLMAQAFRGNIIFPNKKETKFERFYNNHLIENDTYVGGHVEALKTGIYRSDFPQKFKVDKNAYKDLIDNVDKVINFAIEVEHGLKLEDVVNIEEVKQQVVEKLEAFLNLKTSYVDREPLIYHVDVSAMYPNIILSNRLQPVAIVNDEICSSCCFNVAESKCKRHLEWQWKVSYYPLIKKEYEDLKKKFLNEKENEKDFNEKAMKLKLIDRLKKYCSSVYKQNKTNETILKSDIVCMRENPFYVDTVRDFRDRRYQFKNLCKDWTGKMKEAAAEGDSFEEERARNLVALYESLQLAHKIILNSFYGYVMRRGARWYSMEMAAIVTHTGGCIIRDARTLLEQLGIPLELDTDGVWTMLPKEFPEAFDFKLKTGKSVPLNYICSMCNVLIYDKYANPQYQTLIENDPSKGYLTHTEMSIFFEIDGPYKCMMLPAAKEEGKMLKKRYAVFNHKNKMTEMKGFELKRRGELQIVKIFQSEVFEKFLAGNTLQE